MIYKFNVAVMNQRRMEKYSIQLTSEDLKKYSEETLLSLIAEKLALNSFEKNSKKSFTKVGVYRVEQNNEWLLINQLIECAIKRIKKG